MPSCVTHLIHSNEVYNSLHEVVKKDIDTNKNVYNLFAQSHDFFYYSSKKEVKYLGFLGHHENTRAFLIHMINYIKTNNLQNNKELICSLYGYITHYVLDSICHPYIFYKTGVYRHNKETKKYKGLHAKMENDIDAIYYERYYHKSYNKLNTSKEIIGKIKWTPELLKFIDYAYEKTYYFRFASKYLRRSVRKTKRIIRLTSKDRLGVKITAFKLFDLITKSHVASYSNHHVPNSDYLNNEHKLWTNPCYKEIQSTKSFDDLFDEAIKKAVEIIQTTHNYLYSNTDPSTLNIITNIDYASGVDIAKDKIMEYFEF